MSDNDVQSNWEAVRKLFSAAKALPADERLPFVANECGDDEALREQVEALLQASDNDDAAIANIVQSVAADAVGDLSGQIGPYELIRSIGEGGMGRVFLAQHTDKPFKQQVAIKIVSAGIPTKQLLQRMRAERQILANLNHPNVARLLDGGETENGLPYLVMEYVDGMPLFDYCRQEQLTLEDRLRLFITICDAVQHAHQNLVVHRDIKSSNIFVTADGQPKLLDFGIAKLLRPENIDHTLAVTVADARLLTPANASPEQVTGDPVSAATDVYALGLLLYELLVGLPAYSIDETTGPEFARLVCETMPSKPSTRATQSRTVESSDIPDRVLRSLAGDLDTIIMKALRKEPERRYATAAALAEDIQAYLAHRPVAARPDSLAYVFSKFVRRNRMALGASIAFVALAVTAATQIINERNRASLEADNAAAALDFMVETFGSSDPNVTKGDTITAKEVLDRGSTMLKTDDSLSPSARALLGDAIGKVYKNIGLYEPALQQLSASSELHRTLNHKEALIRSLRDVGSTQSLQGDFEAARTTLEEALVLAKTVYPDDHIEVATTMASLAQEVGNSSQHADSIALFKDALAMRTRLGAPVDINYIKSRYGLGEAQMVTGDFAESEANLREALTHATEQIGLRNSITIDIMQSLAVSLHEAGKLEAAEPYYLQSDALEREVLGDDHPNREYSLTSIGRLYRHMGRYDEAETYLRAAVVAAKKSLGDRNVFTAYDMVNLANFLSSRGNYGEAEPLFAEALDVYEEVLPGDHLYKASANIGFAKLLHVLDRPDEAQVYAERAVAIAEVVLPEVHNVKGNAYFVLGLALMGQGELDAAETEMLHGADMIQTATPNDPVLPTMFASLIELYTLRDEQEKVANYEAALDALSTPQDGI